MVQTACNKGNRQQSRFLALVSNKDLLQANLRVAEESEDTGTLQALKALDSIESKLNQVQVAYQQFYTNLGAESVWKTLLDGTKNFINSLNSLPKVFGKIPLNAIAVISNGVSLIRTVLLSALANAAALWKKTLNDTTTSTESTVQESGEKTGKTWVERVAAEINANKEKILKAQQEAVSNTTAQEQINKNFINKFTQLSKWENLPNLNSGAKTRIDLGYDKLAADMSKAGVISQDLYTSIKNGELSAKDAIQQTITALNQQSGNLDQNANKVSTLSAIWDSLKNKNSSLTQGINSTAQALTLLGMAIDKNSRDGQILSGAMTGLGGALQTATSMARVMTGDFSAMPQLIMGVLNVINGLSLAIETPEERLERLQKQAEDLSNTAKQIKADEKTLQSGINKVEELKVKRYESAEAANEYQAAVEDLAEKFPELILGFDEAGNTILDLESAEDALAEARKKTLQATYDAAVAESEAKQQEVENTKDQVKQLKYLYDEETLAGLNASQQSDNSSIASNLASILNSLGYRNEFSGMLTKYGNELFSGELSPKGIVSSSDILTTIRGALSRIYEDAGIDESFEIKDYSDFKKAFEGVEGLDESFEELIEYLDQINERISENIQSDLEIVTSFAARLEEIDFSSEEGREEYNKFKEAYGKLDKETKKDINDRIFNVEKLSKNIEQIVSSSNQSKGVNNSLISSYLQLTKANEKGWEFLEENNQARLLLTNQLTETWINSDEYKNKSWEEFKSSDDFENAVNEFYEAYNQLSEDKQKLLEEIETDTRSYTAQDVKRMLGIGDDKNNPINKYIDNFYKTAEESQKQIEDIFKEYDTHKLIWNKDFLESNPLNTLQQGLENIQESLDFPPEIISFINTRAKEINQLTKDDFIQSAQRLSDQTLSFLSTLYSESMEPQERATIMAILNSANLQTKEGIDEAIEQIQNSNIDDADQKAVIEQLEVRKKELIDNVALSIQADLAQLVEEAEDDSKLLSKVTSGLSVKETNELIQQAQSWGVNLSLKDFIPNGDKLIASENAFNEMQQGYQSKLKAAGDKAQENLDKAKSLNLYDGNNFSIPELLTEDQLKFFEQQLGGFSTDMTNFVDGDTTRLSEVGREKVEEIYKTISDSLFEYGESIGILFQTIFGEANWNKGDYSSLINGKRFSGQNRVTQTGNQAPVIEQIFDVDEFNKYLTGELQYDAQTDPNLKAAVEKARGGVSTFLSDLLSKGADGINISDYAESGIEASDFEQMKADFATIGKKDGMSYQEFVQKYAAWTGSTIEEINNFILQAIQQDNKTSEAVQRKAFSDLTIVGDTITGTEEQINALATALGIGVETLLGEQKADGTYVLITEGIQDILKNLGIIKQSIPNQLKTFSDNINKAADYITKGSNDTAAMQQFADEYAKALDGEAGDYSWEQLFDWDSYAEAYTLSADVYKTYIQAQKDKLNEAGEVDEEVARTIEEARKQLASTVDIDSFLKAENREVGSQAYNKLADQMRDYYSTIYDSEEEVNKRVQEEIETISKGGRDAAAWIQVWAQRRGQKASSSDIETAYRASISQLENAFDQLSYGVGSIVSGEATKILSNIKGYTLRSIGGGSAVIESIGNVTDAYLAYYEELKANDAATVAALNKAYAKVLETRDYSDAISALGDAASMTYTRLGEIFASKGIKLTDELLAQYSDAIQSIGGGKVRITNFDRFATEIMQWTDIDKNSEEYISAFKTYNDSLIDMNRKAERNIVEEVQALENAKAGDWINLTQLISKTDLSMSKFFEKRYFSDFNYTGNVDISKRPIISPEKMKAAGYTDFDGDYATLYSTTFSFGDAVKDLANCLDIVATPIQDLNTVLSDEELAAYIESLVESTDGSVEAVLAADKAQRNLILGMFEGEEIFSEANKEYGEKLHEFSEDWVNSNPVEELQNELQNALLKYGASLENGILKFSDNANIPAVMGTLTNYLQEYGNLSVQEEAELLDTLNANLKSYSDAISNAINGTASNIEIQKISDWANSLGIQIDFTKTIDGLKISQDSAIKLYNELKKIDYLQSQLVFKELSDSLKENNSNYKDMSSILARIKTLEEEINNPNISTARREEYKRELELAKEIKETRALTDPDSFNFMGNDIPDAMKGAENYWNSWGNAFKAMNEAGESGYMGITDFYNIINEMNNLAKMSGNTLTFMGRELSGDAKDAAKLIQEGMGYLANVDGGGVSVALKKFGSNFANGAADMQTGVKGGIKAMAQANIDMLDAMIQQLELVVAMENLKDLTGDDNKIDLSDLFPRFEKGDYTLDQEQKDAIQKIIDAAEENKDLEEALKKYEINGKSMNQWLNDAINGNIKNADDAKIFQATLAALYDALQLGDWSPESIKENIVKYLQENIDAGSWAEFTLTDGTKVQVTHNGYLEEKDGKYYVNGGGQGYDSIEEAKEALDFALKTGLDGAFKNENGEMQKDYEIDQNNKVSVTQNIDGELEYQYNDGEKTPDKFKAINDAYEDYKQKSISEGDLTPQSFDEWVIDKKIIAKFNLTIEDVVQLNGKENIGQLSDKILTELGIDVNLVRAVEAGIERAFSENNGIGNALITAITTALTRVSFDGQNFTISDIPVTAEKITVDTSKATPVFGAITQENIDSAKDWIESKKSSLTVPNIPVTVEKATYSAPTETDASALIDAATTTGKDVNAGLAAGMSDTTAITEKARSNINSIIGTMNTAAGVQAAGQGSTKTLQTGQDIVSGLTQGLGNIDSAVTAGKTLVQQVIEAIQAYLDANPLTVTANVATKSEEKPRQKTSNTTTPSSASVATPNFSGVQNALSTISNTATAVFNNIITKIQAVSAAQDAIKTDKVEAIQTAQDSIEHNKVEDIKTAQEAIENTKVIAIQTAQDSITHNKVDAIQTAQNAIKNDKVKDIQSAQSEIKHNKVDDIKYAQENISTNKIEALKNAINNLSGNVSLGIDIKVNTQGASSAIGSISTNNGSVRRNGNNASWNFSRAFAAGKDILMGELGPELVVSHGRYFLVGQNGPEMVNLDEDAIVFNHLQTKKLIENGKISSHGTPVTNERKATSMATGNFEGPAMASASEVLAMLKQLREKWRSLLNATAKDIGVMAGKAGKTSKGSGADKTADDAKDTEKYTAGIESNVERWYNWLQAIEATQYKINKLTKEYNILEKEGVSTQEKLANLQQQYKLRQENKDTREQLVKEQKAYRNDVINEANRGLMSAFYQADKETGQVYLANDDAFQKFLKRQRAQGLAAGELSSVLAKNGSIREETEITRGLSKKEREAKAEEVVKNSYGRQNKVPSYLRQYYKNGTLIEGQEEEARKAAAEEFKSSKYTKTVKTTREIRTGFDFMAELQAKDDAGNLIHDAEDQLALIKQMGLFTEDLMTGIDQETEGWEAQVVQRFYEKVEEDKEGIESLTESIRDQELAALDEAAAMQEINEKIRSLTAPIGGITKGLEKWYNETVKIREAQQEINKLIKEMTLLQKDQKINGKEIYENYKKQQEFLHKQIAENESFMAKRKKEAAELAKKYGDLPIEIDERGAATFSDRKIGVVNGYGSVNTSYTRSKTIKVGDREYYVDTEGNYRDDQGILRNKNGQQIEGSFGQQAVETVTGHQAYNFSGKTIQELVKDLTSKDAYGNWNFQGEEVFQILEAAGYGDYMQYDENGNKIYDNLGALTPEEMQKAAQAAVTRLQTAVTKINQNNDEIVNLDEENLKLQSDLLAIDQALIDNQIEVENMVKDAVIQEHQDAIDTKKELKDALDNAASRTVDGLREGLEQERSMYDKAENQKQLDTLQRQLEVAQRSGASLSKIQGLQDQVAGAQKDMYFTEREELIDNIENSMQREIEALDTQISIMEATLEFQKENGLLWADVNKILAGTPASIIDYITKNNPASLSDSETQRAQSLIDIGDKVGMYAARRDDDKKDTDEKIEQLGEQIRASQQLQEEEDQSEDVGDVYTPQTSTLTTQPAQQQQQDEEEGTIEITFENGFSPEMEELGASLDLSTKLVQPEGTVWDDAWNTNRKRGYNESEEAYGIKSVLLKAKKLAGGKLSNQDILEAFKTRYIRQFMNEQDTPAQIAEQWNSWNDEQIKKVLKAELKRLGKTVPKFDQGGNIDFTGLARVDGSKNEPEHIFNFQQMEALRAHLLNGVDVTRQAISGLSDMLNQMPSISTYNSINNTTDSGISIGTLEFHMEVSEISNGYDARKAGEEAMNEIVRIARKSGTRSLSRR